MRGRFECGFAVSEGVLAVSTCVFAVEVLVVEEYRLEV